MGITIHNDDSGKVNLLCFNYQKYKVHLSSLECKLIFFILVDFKAKLGKFKWPPILRLVIDHATKKNIEHRSR